MPIVVSPQENLRTGPLTGLQIVWSAAVGSDISIVLNGLCPRSIRVGSPGTLVCNLIDGTSVTLAAVHMNAAAPPLEVGNVISFSASGSSAFNILLGY